MPNLYLAKDIDWLRKKRDELFELLDKGRITRLVEGPSQVTELSEKGLSIEDALKNVIQAIAVKDGATEEEIAAAESTKKRMKICTTY